MIEFNIPKLPIKVHYYDFIGFKMLWKVAVHKVCDCCEFVTLLIGVIHSIIAIDY